MITGSELGKVSDYVGSFLSNVGGVVSPAGRAILNQVAPNDFEYYLCSIEVVDANDLNNVLEFFTFPITPNNMSVIKSKSKTVTKTADGISVLENNSFVPIEMSISGDFGRKLKIITRGGSDVKSDNILTRNVKTGYGCVKVLENIYNRTSNLYNGLPVLVFFYNYAFNANYLIEVTSFQASQDISKNMIWNYAMSFKAIAPADDIIDSPELKKRLSKYTTIDSVQKSAKNVLSFTSSALTSKSTDVNVNALINQEQISRGSLNKLTSLL
jgi:hypothetical protein